MSNSESLLSVLQSALANLPRPLTEDLLPDEASGSSASFGSGSAPLANYRFIAFFDEYLDGAIQYQAEQLEFAIQDAISSAGKLCRSARSVLASTAELTGYLEHFGITLKAINSHVMKSFDLSSPAKLEWRNAVLEMQQAADNASASLARLISTGNQFEAGFEQFSELPKLLSGGIWHFVKHRPRGTQQVFKQLLQPADDTFQVLPVDALSALVAYARQVNDHLTRLVGEVQKELAQLNAGSSEKARTALEASQAVVLQFGAVYNDFLRLTSLVKSSLTAYGQVGTAVASALLAGLEDYLLQVPRDAELTVLVAPGRADMDASKYEVVAHDTPAAADSLGKISRTLACGLALDDQVLLKARVAING